MQVSGSIRIPFVVNGVDGKDGKGIREVTNYYARSQVLSAPALSSFTTTIPEISAEYPYLWNYELTEYSDGSQSTTTPHVIAYFSEDGRGIREIVEYYLASEKGSGVTNDINEGYTTEVQTITEAKPYLWNFEEVTYDDGTTQKTQARVIGVYGSGGVSLQVTPEIVVFDEETTSQEIEVRAFVGSGQVEVNATNLTVTSHVDNEGVQIGDITGSSDGTATVTVSQYKRYTDRAEGHITFSVPVSGATLTRYVGVRTVKDGEDGDPGEKGDKGDPGANGDDAVYYHMESSANSATYYPGRKAFSPESVTFTMYRTKGSETEELACYWYVRFKDSVGNTYSSWFSQTAAASVTIPLDQGDFLTSELEVTACERLDTGSEYDGCQRTITAGTSCAVRYQKWDDCAEGFRFESGAVGETYIDIVSYDGKCFQCKKSHTKADGTEPTTGDAQDQYWLGVNTFKNVATDLLLAKEATIDNLYVNDVYMEGSGDKRTALWISPEHDGMKILRMGDGFQTGRENTRNNGWDNPTTWFHGGDIPAVDKIYDAAVQITEALPAWEYSNTNSLSIDIIEDATHLSTNYNNVSGLTAGALTRVTIASRSISFTMVNGSSDTLEYSEAMVELRLYDGDSYITLASTTIVSESKTWTLDVDKTFTPSSTSVTIRWALTYIALCPGGSFRVAQGEAIRDAVSFTSVAEAYVSQFGANGVFIGYRSDSYFRLALDASAVRHTLLAGGFGLDVTEQGALQFSGGASNRMPVGGTLLLAHFTVNRSVKGTVWTFDGQSPVAHYTSAGVWYLDMPNWVSTLGLTSSSDYCATITPISADYPATAQAYQFYVNSNGTFSLRVYTCVNGELADCDVFVRVDYIGIDGGGAKTISSDDTNSLNGTGTEDGEEAGV